MSAPARWLPDEVMAHLREVAGADPDAEEEADPARRGGVPPASSRYELIEVLGQGGMGTVYRARDRDLGREVALKVVAAPATGWVDAPEARLLAEARILARLEHPGLVPVHDLGTLPDGRVFYAMKRVRGRRLDAYARERRAGGRGELLRVFERICETVAFAHAHGVIHRDLKPENVMVGSFGEVLVLDWGLAKVRATPLATGSAAPDAPAGGTVASLATFAGTATFEGFEDFESLETGESLASTQSTGSTERMGISGRFASPATSPGVALGTPGYMAPERSLGAPADERSDVFALGAILRFLLTGSPKTAATATGGGVGGSVPKPLLAICAKATAEDPERRYGGAVGLAADLARYTAGSQVEAFPEGLARRAGRLARRHAAPLLLLLAYLLMRVVLLLFARHP